jgi:transcription elongation factor GreA
MVEEKIQYVTQQGYNDLQAELVELKDNKIPDIARRIDEAKQQGDLSENAEYHQAREDMSWARGRLLELQNILDNAKIMGETNNTDVVSIGSTVKVEDGKGNEKEYTIVGPQEADPLSGRVSNESPLGKSFLGLKKDNKAEVETPAGVQVYKILQIS